MAVDAVASVILHKLMDLLSEESFANNKMIVKQLKEMENTLKEMKGFFIDAANKEKKGIKKWTDEYLKNLYDVEDSIESFALRITRQRKRLGFLMNHALFLKKFTACKMLTRKLEKIQRNIEALNDQKPAGLENASLERGDERGVGFHSLAVEKANSDIHEEVEREEDDATDNDKQVGVEEKMKLETDDLFSTRKHSFGTSPVSVTDGSPRSLFRNNSFKRRPLSIIRARCQQSKLLFNYSYDEEVLSIVGYNYKRHVHEIMNKLTKKYNRPDPDRIISVEGARGSGKTMLARAVYGNRTIKNQFDAGFCAWATVFKESTATDILLNLLKQVQKSKQQDDGIYKEDMLKESLHRELEGHKYLMVLDGVQSSDQWESLKDAFPDNQNGSKIMVTTCDRNVALRANPNNLTHSLKELSYEDSWYLFKKVGATESTLASLKHKIIEVCRGLPLNIVLLGSLLSTKKDKGIDECIRTLENQEIWNTSEILMMSYNDLDAHLKLCLLYMLLFPRELDIPVRRLQRLWLAEGFVQHNQDIFQEDVVQYYFDNLVKRSLVLVSKLRSDGSPRKCRLLGVVHDFLLEKARDVSLFHVHTGATCNEFSPLGKRRLVEYTYTDGKSCSLEHQRLRSYISFNFQKKDIPAKDVGSLLANVIGKKGFGLLRVLDLEGVYRPSLPDNLGDLFHLRYLGLRWTFLDKLPKSVGQLLYLETLDLKRTHINRIPPSIWKLKHLRHLNLDEVHLDKDMINFHSDSSLPKLLTLWGLSVDQESPVKNFLSKFTHLRELGISIRLSTCDDHDMSKLSQLTEDLVDWISTLKYLQSLRLRSKYDSGRPSDLSLKPLTGLEKLSHLYLLGKLQKLPERCDFPPNIKVLTLSVSQLDIDPMPILGQIQSLTVLRLLANSYLGEKIVCPKESFKGLKVLKLWMLKNLKKWELEEGSMENLKELNIRFCSKLENIPSVLLQQETFKDLILTNMPSKFKEDVANIIANNNILDISVDGKDYELTPLPWEEDYGASNGMAVEDSGHANGGA